MRDKIVIFVIALFLALGLRALAQNLPPTMTSGAAGTGAVAQPGGAYSISPLTHAPATCPTCIQMGTVAFGSLPSCTAALAGAMVYVTGATGAAAGATCTSGATGAMAYCNGTATAWKCN